MKLLKVLVLITVAYSVIVTALYLTDDCQSRLEDLSVGCLTAQEEHIRIKNAMNDELFEMKQKYESRIDSLEERISNRH
jgi:hypothetical protein